MRLEQETVWLTMRQMAELFERDRSVVNRHVLNVFQERELERGATCADLAQVRPEGGRRVTRKIDHFNLDVIISVGYRVKSLRGTQFRQWATRRLREHLVSGYTLNRQRLAERGLREARDALDVLTRTLRNQALVETRAGRSWNLSRATPIHGGCCSSTTRIASRLRQARGRRPPPSITGRRSRRLRTSGRH